MPENGINLPNGARMHTEEIAPGVVLENYTKRAPSEDNTYVVITEHAERIELIPQPLTPEEIAAQEHEAKMALAGLGVIAVIFAGVLGVMAWKDARDQKKKLIETSS